MCGIAGYIRLDGQAADSGVLRAMCDVITHRGPDSEGLMVAGPAALGMRRLSIIDVSTGDQPFLSNDENLAMVYNGECYNFQEIRDELAGEGVSFRSHSDTEAVLRLYERDGEEALERLRGMYAFAIWNRESEELLLVRDRMGQKPLYYWRNESLFFYASEIKSIRVGMEKLGLSKPDLDHAAIAAFMAYGYVPDPLSAYNGIQKLPPAHRLRLSLPKKQLDSAAYWELDPYPNPRLSEAEAFASIESALDEAVRLRMIADVPLGAYLSGGVDSSTIVALMARHSTRPVKTFSIGFKEEAYNELEYARVVAKHLGTDHHELIVEPDASDIIEDIVKQFDEPFADSSAIPTYFVSKMAREQVTVVLSGDGGDELFGGYARYQNAGPAATDFLPQPLRQLTFGTLAQCLPLGFFGRARLHSLSLNEDERYIHHLTCGLSEWHRDLFHPDFAADGSMTDPSSHYARMLSKHPNLDATSRRMFADSMIYLPADIMTKVDRMSMMVSLEARAPMLDHKFVEAAAKVPLPYKISAQGGKKILKDLARSLVPAEVIDRKKKGFAIPLSHWFNAAWMEKADDLLVGSQARQRGIFNTATIDRILTEHRSQRRDHSQLVWSLMVLELWLRGN